MHIPLPVALCSGILHATLSDTLTPCMHMALPQAHCSNRHPACIRTSSCYSSTFVS